jgi:hypothetical protein
VKRLPWLVGALGVLLLVVGIAVFALADTAGFGWTSYTAGYAPLGPDDVTADWYISFADGSVLWTAQHALGAGFVVSGLLVLVGLGGWLLGRRPGRSGASAG